jgi:hypothetical protein
MDKGIQTEPTKAHPTRWWKQTYNIRLPKLLVWLGVISGVVAAGVMWVISELQKNSG